jgi:hypothetical protein
MFYKWVLNKVAGWVARYPRTALGIVIGYLVLSIFELIPVVEIVSDFIVVLGYVLIRLYIAKKRSAGEPIKEIV